MEVISVLKLMKLEIIKFRFKGFIRGAVFTTLGMLGFLILIGYTTQVEGEVFFNTSREAVDMINTLVNDAFLIFSAVMLSKFVIGEYSKGTINILFTYPINRKKLMAAKLLTVGSFMVVTMIAANLFIMTVLYFINARFGVIPVVLDLSFMLFALGKVLIYSFAFTAMSTICLFFGMKKKSQAATIVSSVIIVSVVGSSNNGFTLSAFVFIPVTLALVGMLLSYMTFKNIEHVDV